MTLQPWIVSLAIALASVGVVVLVNVATANWQDRVNRRLDVERRLRGDTERRTAD